MITMVCPHPHPYHRGSLFCDGPRKSLNRDQRAAWRARLELQRRTGWLTPLYVHVGLALLRRLSADGRCDPSQETLARDAGCSLRTVQRALPALMRCGMLTWTRRLVRNGQRVAQTSNAYEILLNKETKSPQQRDRHIGRGIRRRDSIAPVWEPDPPEIRQAAQAALAAVAASMKAKLAAEWLRKRQGSGFGAAAAGMSP
jgi:DNA-binding transcriptional MocR family regulator